MINFAEIFVNDGFDVVMANPPYVRQEKIKHLKVDLKRRFPKEYSGTADLYCYFYLRAFEMLKPDGMISFISSNKWLRADYGGPLRSKLAEVAAVRSITDFGELPVFETAATFPMIFVAQKYEPSAQDSFTFTQVKNLDPPYPDIALVIAANGSILPRTAVSSKDWRLVSTEKTLLMHLMDQSGVPLSTYIDNKIYRGVLTGFNEAFFIDAVIRKRLIAEDRRSKEIIFPLAIGDDVRRWRINQKDRYLIFTRRGIDIEQYPAIKRHLSQWKAQLSPKKK